MYSIEILSIVAELSERIEGDYFKKFYEVDKGTFLIKFRDSVVIDLRGYIFLGKLETPIQPTPFAMLVRKHLENKKLLSVEQHEFERIVKMDFGSIKIIIELFGEGNFVLVDENGIVLMPYYTREFRHRVVRKGEVYKFPPALKNPLSLTPNDFVETFREEKKEVVKVLARDLNFGGIYAEEICRRAGIEKTTPACNVDWKAIHDTIVKMVEEARSHRGYVYENLASPIRFSNLEPIEVCELLSDAITKVYEREARESVVDEELNRLTRVLKTQEENLTQLLEEESRYRKIADLIYERYDEVNDRLLAGEKKILVDGYEIILDGSSVEEIAGRYYEAAKKVRMKIEGLKNAIEETKKKIEERKAKEETKVEFSKKRKTFWFENYRWFITSSGMIVVAGKDAKTNEKVVKKYLTDRDLYFHADIHGAPSVVLKTDGKDVDEKTIEEVAIFSVCFSKAWQNNLWGVSAYYVNAHQVSKQAESGEYVPKGAWVIRGKKNYVHKIPLRLAVGVVEYEGVELVMCGPVSAVAQRSKKYVIIEPGELSKDQLSKEISKILDWPNIEEIQKVLPPGDSKIVSINTT